MAVIANFDISELVERIRASLCHYESRWGRCQQRAQEDGLCPFHLRWAGRGSEPDPYLHRKIVLGLTQPVDTYLSEGEIKATLVGTRHEDGRHLDQYVLPDAVEGYTEITGERVPQRLVGIRARNSRVKERQRQERLRGVA